MRDSTSTPIWFSTLIIGAIVLLWIVLPRFSCANTPTTAPSAPPGADSPLPYSLLSPIGAHRPPDPIAKLADHMRVVAVDLAIQETDRPVQTRQKQIVSSLDELIAELQKECTGSGGGNPNPTRPMARSQITGGPGGSGPLHDPHAGTRVWGQLPPKERDQILQSQTEGFPPGYESVLANYYTRLAQNQGADSSSPEAGPTTQAVSP